MANNKEDNLQLTLPVSVSPFQSWMISVRKTFRHLKYSPVALLVRHFLFWVQVGVLGALLYMRFMLANITTESFGVLNNAASVIPGFFSQSLHSLSKIDYVVGAAIFVTFMTWITSIAFYSFGKHGIVSFVLIFGLLLLALFVKVVATPILLLGLT